ncbi:glycosyltransferase family 2 protein [Fulvimarina endophytica]|uniref:Glycosyltransferase family 2 protein n=1 Tax=Fulvimarina endophytica TaxID=2293836 RepID=A0A371X0V1_9HYPH|nr:glycosyltransferase [Fulvimarina endophytica]RFC62835.1 glycosyltransferase family 2 protein [Fulvimarina endophytica]
MKPTISIRHVSPATAPVEAVVILPTFKRPDHVVRSLDSLYAQTTGRRFAIIVMENDAVGLEGLGAATSWFEAHPSVCGIALVAHEQGNCSAYNAGIATALETYREFSHLLIIDDDELASETWLERMLETSERLDLDLVGGPQIPVFEDGTGERWARHPVFTPHYRTTGPVPILFSSGNVAIRRHVLTATGPDWLDPAFNFIGGGDADFYTRCRARGYRFGWCQDAPVMETMPRRRTEASWINARSVRNGAISSIVERRNGDGRNVKRHLRTIALLGASPLRSAALALKTRSLSIGIYHMQVAAGRFLGEFGKVAEQYRQPEKN